MTLEELEEEMATYCSASSSYLDRCWVRKQVLAHDQQQRDEVARLRADLKLIYDFMGMKYDVDANCWHSTKGPHLSAGNTAAEAAIATIDAYQQACLVLEEKLKQAHAALEEGA